jgi:hypothetical protein
MPYRLPVRRAVALMCASWFLFAMPHAVAAPASTSTTTDPRAARSELLLRIADLTDRVEGSDAAVVAAQLRVGAAGGALAAVRTRMRERAVQAYMRGTAAGIKQLAAPEAYLDVAARKERQLVASWRTASQEALAGQQRAESTRVAARQAAAQLEQLRAGLDATIAADDAQRAEAERQADEARARAIAARAAELAAARGRAIARQGGSPSAGGYDPTPLDPNALLPRHKAATAAQQALMRRWPFGPVPAGVDLPVGLHRTGVQLDGTASWYGADFDGRPTASGAIYDMEGWTVASPDLPLGTFLIVRTPAARVLLLVNDRGPYVTGRILDLSHAAAVVLGIGVGPVTAEIVAP